MAEQAQQLRVFVSHSSQDDAFCQAIVQALRDASADVWYDEHNLGSGQLQDVILHELDTRPIFVVILSKAAMASKWVKHETDWAWELTDRDPSRVMLPVTAEQLKREDFNATNGWLAYYGYKRIEAPGYAPYPIAEASNRLVHALALTPTGQAPAPLATTPQERSIDLVTRGKALNAQGMYAEALSIFEEMIKQDPDSFDSWFSLGIALNGIGDWQQALMAFERALNINPQSEDAWLNKGVMLVQLGRNAEAISAFQRAIDITPDFAGAWNGQGDAYGNLGHHQEAAEAYEQAVTLSPKFTKAWINSGVELLHMHRDEEALAAFNRAIDIEPTRAVAWHNKGVVLSRLGRQKEADEALRRAKELGWKG